MYSSNRSALLNSRYKSFPPSQKLPRRVTKVPYRGVTKVPFFRCKSGGHARPRKSDRSRLPLSSEQIESVGVNYFLSLSNTGRIMGAKRKYSEPSVVFEAFISVRMRLNFDKHFKIKMSDRNFTQRFDVFMTSLSSDNKITVQQCYICGERCDYSLTYLFKQIVSRGWNPIATPFVHMALVME